MGKGSTHHVYVRDRAESRRIATRAFLEFAHPSCGELLVERPRGLLALLERDQPVGLVRGVQRVVGQREAGHDRGDAALGERCQDRQRPAGADERRLAPGHPLQRAPRRDQRGVPGVEGGGLGAVGAAERQLGAVGQRVT